MKRVCHVSSAHRGLDTRIFHKECVSLANAGYDTHLVIHADADEIVEAGKRDVTIHPLERVPNRHRLSRMSTHARRSYLAAKQIDADIYHLHDPELIPYGLLFARSGKHVIFDAHEDLPGEIYTKDWIPLAARHAAAGLARAFQRYAAPRLSAVVGATPFIGTLFEGVAKRVTVINNYPLLGELAPNDSNTTRRDSVCYVGGIEEIRGIKEIVQAIGNTASELLLAGEFSTDELRNQVKQYEGWRKVKEYGFVDRKRVSEIMARSFCGLVTLREAPNFVNSQPIKMFEYMSAGVPVIASRFPLWIDVIEGNQCGICVDQNDPKAIASAIRHLQDNPEEVARMGGNGRRAVERIYRWDREEVKLVSLYQDLLGR